MPSFEQSQPTQESFLASLGKRLGFSKKEADFLPGEKLKLVEVNTGQLMEAEISRIGRNGQIEVRFKDYSVPRYFPNHQALNDELEATRYKGAERIKYAQLKKAARPETLKPELKHEAYTMIGSAHEVLYKGRERITSRTESVQGKIFMPDGAEELMEAIVVDYDKDPILQRYLDTQLLPAIFRHQISRKTKDFSSAIAAISEKIHQDFPYQHKMLDKTYAISRYPAGKKFSLGHFMQNQDMVCRHMALLFAVSIDYLKQRILDVYVGIPTSCSIRVMSDMESDLLKNEKDGHAYCVLREGGTYYVVDPTSGMAKNVLEILSSPQHSDIKYRYLFSAARVMLQENSEIENSTLITLISASLRDPKLAGLVSDLERTITTDHPTRVRLALLKQRAQNAP